MDKPALFLVPHPAPRKSTPSGRPRRELLYAWEGKIKLPTDEEWRAMDKEIEDEMLNGQSSHWSRFEAAARFHVFLVAL